MPRPKFVPELPAHVSKDAHRKRQMKSRHVAEHKNGHAKLPSEAKPKADDTDYNIGG